MGILHFIPFVYSKRIMYARVIYIASTSHSYKKKWLGFIYFIEVNSFENSEPIKQL